MRICQKLQKCEIYHLFLLSKFSFYYHRNFSKYFTYILQFIKKIKFAYSQNCTSLNSYFLLPLFGKRIIYE